MKERDFLDRERKSIFFRLIDFLSYKKIIITSLGILLVGGVLGLIEGSFDVLLGFLPIILFTSITAGLLLLRWSRNRLANTIENIRPAFIDLEQFDKSVDRAFVFYPSTFFTLLIGVVLVIGGCLLIPASPAGMTLAFLVFLLVFASTLLSFGLLGFVFICILVYRISCEDIDLFYDFYTKPLSTYICGLGSIGLITSGIVFSAWIQLENNLLLALFFVGFPLSVLGFILMEYRVWLLIYKARCKIIHVSSENQKKLWDTLDQEGIDQKEVLDEIEKLEKVNEAVKKRRVNFIPWNELFNRIIIPIVILIVIFLFQIQIKRMMPSDPPGKTSTESKNHR